MPAATRASLLHDAGQRDEREQDAQPAGGAEHAVGRAKVEQARRRAERHRLDESRHREQAVLAEQRHELIDDDDEGDEIDEREAALEDEPRIPVP